MILVIRGGAGTGTHSEKPTEGARYRRGREEDSCAKPELGPLVPTEEATK